MKPNHLSKSLLVLSIFLATLGSAGNSAGAAENPNCTASDGDYIVSFQAGASVNRELRALPGNAVTPRYTYNKALNGFAAFLKSQQVCALQANPNVLNIEQDSLMSIQDIQKPATWGLTELIKDQKTLDSTYNYAATASNVYAYVIDTGINVGHQDFGTRVQNGINFIGSTAGDTNFADCNGHGTHVAGTIGGSTYGVAKQVKLIPVRVLDCSGSGSTSGVIAGINWVANHSVNAPKVANMSLGGGFSQALNEAVRNASQNTIFVVAAGNSNANACNSSPASEPSAITVGATTSTDARASYSNFGNCLDIFAPGSSITSTWIGSSSATNTISGTSMASPHVAGAVALLLSNTSYSFGQIESLLENNSTPDILTSIGTGSPNLLLATPTALPWPSIQNIPAAASNFVLSSPRKGVLSVSWNISTSGSSNISRYLVQLYNQSGRVGNLVNLSSNSLSASYSFSGLRTGTSYWVGVVSCNSQSLCSSESTSRSLTVR